VATQATTLLGRAPAARRVRVLARLVQLHQERLTARGRFVMWTMLALGVLGLDTHRTQVYMLFAPAAAMLLVAAVYALYSRPRVRLDCRLPERATAQTPVGVTARVTPEQKTQARDVSLSFHRSLQRQPGVTFEPRDISVVAEPEKSAEARTQLRIERRGRYVLRGPAARVTDPLRLVTSRAIDAPEQALLVYPRYYSMESFPVPLGRRYQPGGIPLTSSTGDAIEFVGTREYREGDPLKNIHWRSWARRGEPVVKEFQEEYFCRIALILDTFVPPAARGKKAGGEAFEAAISVVASIADFFSRSEYVVDILAAGPDVYEVSAGRSLAYLENILDVLACLEPCHEPPFEAIGPQLFEKLAQITTVVAVLQDWDAPREAFLRRVKSLGTAVRALIVHRGPTREPWQQIGSELGEMSQLTPEDVERLLARGA
jgi:uncharacterized protein (DUF58 family)